MHPTMVAQRSCLLLVAFAVTLTAASSVLPADSAPVSNGTAPSPSPAPAPGNHTDPCGPGECSGLGCLFVDVTCANVVPMNFGGTVQLLLFSHRDLTLAKTSAWQPASAPKEPHTPTGRPRTEFGDWCQRFGR